MQGTVDWKQGREVQSARRESRIYEIRESVIYPVYLIEERHS